MVDNIKIQFGYMTTQVFLKSEQEFANLQNCFNTGRTTYQQENIKVNIFKLIFYNRIIYDNEQI